MCILGDDGLRQPQIEEYEMNPCTMFVEPVGMEVKFIQVLLK